MPDKEKSRRGEVQKLLKFLAKKKGLQKKSSASEQSNTSSEESMNGEDPKSPDGAKSGSTSTSKSDELTTADLLENADLIKMLVKRNAELSQKEKIVKYLERERQKIDRRSESIKKREAKLMADMVAVTQRESDSKMSLLKQMFTVSKEGQKSSEDERTPEPSIRALPISKFRSRKDSSGSEDVASLSETDASDFEGSKRALEDEELRETRKLERLKKSLETPDSFKRPGRKEMLVRRIAVLEKILASNKAMLESSTHVMPKIRKPKFAVQEKQSQSSQETEDSSSSTQPKEPESISENSKVSERVESHPKSPVESPKPDVSDTESSVTTISSESVSISTPTLVEEGIPTPVESETKSSEHIVEEPPRLLEEPNPVITPDDSKSDSSNSTPLSSHSKDPARDADIEETSVNDPNNNEEVKNEKKADAVTGLLVDSLCEDVVNEVKRATKLEEHASIMMRRLVDEAVDEMNKVMTAPERQHSEPSLWSSQEKLSPIGSLSGSLGEIGQQLFVDDTSQQVCIRNIPNKPPPPYTFPKMPQSEPTQPKAVSIAPVMKDPRPPEPVVPMTLGELQTEASHAAEYLFEQLISGTELGEASYEDTHCQGVADMAKVQYGEMLFDVAKETAEKLFRLGRNAKNLYCRPLPARESHQTFIDTIVGDILKSEKSKVIRPKSMWSFINNRRMDYIDFLMGKEIREEEREWTDYKQYIEIVKEQVVEKVYTHIVETSVADVFEHLDC